MAYTRCPSLQAEGLTAAAAVGATALLQQIGGPVALSCHLCWTCWPSVLATACSYLCRHLQRRRQLRADMSSTPRS